MPEVRRADQKTDLVAGEISFLIDRKSTRLNSSHSQISYAVFCLKKKNADSRELERKLAGTENPPRYYRCDLTNIEAIRQTFARIRSDIGSADELGNNVVNYDRRSLKETTEKYWDNRIAVNLRHLFVCTQAVTEDMKADNGGVIITLGSVSFFFF